LAKSPEWGAFLRTQGALRDYIDERRGADGSPDDEALTRLVECHPETMIDFLRSVSIDTSFERLESAFALVGLSRSAAEGLELAVTVQAIHAIADVYASTADRYPDGRWQLGTRMLLLNDRLKRHIGTQYGRALQQVLIYQQVIEDNWAELVALLDAVHPLEGASEAVIGQTRDAGRVLRPVRRHVQNYVASTAALGDTLPKLRPMLPDDPTLSHRFANVQRDVRSGPLASFVIELRNMMLHVQHPPLSFSFTGPSLNGALTATLGSLRARTHGGPRRSSTWRASPATSRHWWTWAASSGSITKRCAHRTGVRQRGIADLRLGVG
jgi:hypothetical protein